MSVDATRYDQAVGRVVHGLAGPRGHVQLDTNVCDSTVASNSKVRPPGAGDVDDGSPNDEHLGSLAQCWDKNDAGRGGSR